MLYTTFRLNLKVELLLITTWNTDFYFMEYTPYLKLVLDMAKNTEWQKKEYTSYDRDIWGYKHSRVSGGLSFSFVSIIDYMWELVVLWNPTNHHLDFVI